MSSEQGLSTDPVHAPNRGASDSAPHNRGGSNAGRWYAMLGLAVLSLSTVALGAGPGANVWRSLTVPTAGQNARLEPSVGTAADNPYGFTTSTTATECASSCHQEQLGMWGHADDSDFPPVPVWDAQDEAGNVDPYNTAVMGSLHALSWQDWEFQSEYHALPKSGQGTCQRCHLPDVVQEPQRSLGVYAPATRGTRAANVLDGISCVNCHLNSSGQITGDVRYNPSPTQHEVVVSPAFDGVTLCASCHNDPVFGAFTRTVDEYTAHVPDGGAECVDCHMKSSSGVEGAHLWQGGHSPGKTARGLSLTIPTTASSIANYVISAANLSTYHNVPTGDVFRAYAVHLTLTDSAGNVAADKQVFVTQPISTPTQLEVMNYPYVPPVEYNQTAFLSFDKIPTGTYAEHVELVYYLTKPTSLKNRGTGRLEVIDEFGKSVTRTWDQTLLVQ